MNSQLSVLIKVIYLMPGLLDVLSQECKLDHDTNLILKLCTSGILKSP